MLDEKLQSLVKRHSHGRTMIGIDGLSGSGKTSLAHHIHRDLLTVPRQTVLFHLDDHIVPSCYRYHSGRSIMSFNGMLWV